MRLTRPNRLGALGLPIAAALVLSGCGAVDEPPAATVGGDGIPTSEVLAEVDLIRSDEALRQQYEAQGLAVQGDVEGSYDTGFVASVLQNHIYLKIAERELERRDAGPDQQQLDEARQLVVQQFGERVDQVPDEFIDSQARQQAVVAALGDALVGDDAEAFFEEDPAAFAEVCVSHVFVSAQERGPQEAQARAQELAAQLEGGASFDQLATDESDDDAAAQEGGSLGCGGRGRFIPQFEDAVFALDEGQVSDPVETPIGYHIIRVDERRERTFEQAEEDVTAALAQQAGPAVSEFITGATADADVEVNPRFGRWVVQEGAAGRVVPPQGPAAPAGQGQPAGGPAPGAPPPEAPPVAEE